MIDACIPYAMRDAKLDTALSYLPADEVGHAYVASVAPDPPAIDPAEYAVDVTILDAGSDYYAGRARRVAYEATDAEYVLVIDSDCYCPPTLFPLRAILDADETLGGVAGMLAEPNQERIRHTAKHFRDHTPTLLQSAQFGVTTIKKAAGYPVAAFDKLPNATLFRRAALEDYAWDRKFPKRAHLDFYLAHWRHTDWRFGATTAVSFWHDPGGSDAYTDLRQDEERHQHGLDRIAEKWGFEEIETLGEPWLYTAHRKGIR